MDRRSDNIGSTHEGSRTFQRCFKQVSPELHLVWDHCRLNYLKVLEPGARNRFAVALTALRSRVERFAVAMRGERGEKRGPCAFVGCKDPTSPSGQWNWLPPEEDLAGLEVELVPGAVCFCQKVGCREAMGKRSRKRKLKEHMAGVGANDPCVPSHSTRSRRSKRFGASGTRPMQQNLPLAPTHLHARQS